jgi:Cdc6-like AAA superfamily ATPase
MTDEIETLSLSGQVVLLSMTALAEADETPAHTGTVIQASAEHVEAVDADTLGKLSESEVNRALNRLEDAGLVETAPLDDASPTGKGRPAYELGVPAGTVLETLGDDEDVASLADRIAGGTA